MKYLSRLKRYISVRMPGQDRLLVAVVFGLPLLAVPFSQALNKPFRWGLLVTVAAAIVALLPLRNRLLQNILSLNRLSLAALILIVLAIIFSTLQSNLSTAVRIVGWDTEYLGLLTWVSFFVIAVGLRHEVKGFLRSRAAVLAVGLVMILSLATNFWVLYYGFRFTGLLQQATSMGMYAAFALLLSIWHLAQQRQSGNFRKILWVVTVIAVGGVLLSQSRIAQFAALFSCLAVAISAWFHARKFRIVPLATAAVLLLLPLFMGAYFDRLRSEQVQEGFSYRADIYKSSVHDIVTSNYVLGSGASGVPETINSRNTAPPGIVESLDRGFVFLSAHDIFLDVALCFGLIAGIAFLLLSLQALGIALSHASEPAGLLIGCAFLILLLNGIFNVPSIEMTLLLIAMLVVLLPERKQE